MKDVTGTPVRGAAATDHADSTFGLDRPWTSPQQVLREVSRGSHTHGELLTVLLMMHELHYTVSSASLYGFKCSIIEQTRG
eukprot:jgi/Botrbrau1/147/Bobra.0022s0132.1